MSRNQKQFIEEEIKPIKYRNCLYRMKLAQYDVEVNCTKKKEGRQLAAQRILQVIISFSILQYRNADFKTNFKF